MNRRRFLATLGLAATAGCQSFGQAQHEISNSEWENTESAVEAGAEVWHGETTLEPGTYTARGFQVRGGLRIRLEISADDPVDVFTMDDDEYDDRYREASEDFQFYRDLSETDEKDVELESRLAGGRYMFVVDNTGVYGAAPNSGTDIEFTMAWAVV